MFYYLLESSHWPMELEFKSKIPLKEGQCFRILKHDGWRSYPTRFKVLKILEAPVYAGSVIEITEVDTNVEPF